MNLSGSNYARRVGMTSTKFHHSFAVLYLKTSWPVLQVSSAAPVAAALASGTASESTLSYLYGGSAVDGVSELSMAIPVYEAIGKVSLWCLTPSKSLQKIWSTV